MSTHLAGIKPGSEVEEFGYARPAFWAGAPCSSFLGWFWLPFLRVAGHFAIILPVNALFLIVNIVMPWSQPYLRQGYGRQAARGPAGLRWL